jgi:hypothetical protein
MLYSTLPPYSSALFVCTRTVSITHLAGALQQAVENVFQSLDPFDINSPLQIEFELQLNWDMKRYGLRTVNRRGSEFLYRNVLRVLGEPQL